MKLSQRHKFFLGLMVLNTVLFTLAGLYNLSKIWVFGGELALFFAYIAKKAWNSQAQKLCNQATGLNWVFAGTLKDVNGYQDTLFTKEGIVVRVSFEDGKVFSQIPLLVEPFADFNEVEQYFQIS